MDQRSKTTSHLKRYLDTVQHRELRSDRGSWFINEVFRRLALFTSMTPSRQEIDHPTSSSSSSTSPTMTSSSVSRDSVTRQARRDLCGIDSYPVTVSSKHVERQERGEICSTGTPEEELLTKPTKNPKPSKNEDHDLER